MDKTHFKYNMIKYSIDICVGVRVAIDGINYLPKIGLYNGSYNTVVNSVYKNGRSTGPNGREYDPLLDYILVDFPHLILSKLIKPWDENNTVVSATSQRINTRTKTGVSPIKISSLKSLAQHVPFPIQTALCSHNRKEPYCHSHYCPLFQCGLQLFIHSKASKLVTVNLIN